MKKTNEIKQKESRYIHESLEKIESDRNSFLTYYRRHNSLKILVSVFCLALIVVACIVLPSVLPENSTALKNGLTIGLTILAIVILLGYSFLVRKLTDKKMKAYFESFYKNTSDFVFGSECYSDIEIKQPGKITVDQFNECLLYKNVIEAGSRGLTEFKYNGLNMSVVDCAGNIKGEKRMMPVFVGKCVRSTTKYNEQDPIFIYLKGNEKSLPPTNVDGIEKVEENTNYIVWTNCKNWKKVIGAKLLKEIVAIKTNEILVDLAISVYGGKVFVMMGYDDPLMILPLQNVFDSKPTEMYKENLLSVCKIIEGFNK